MPESHISCKGFGPWREKRRKHILIFYVEAQERLTWSQSKRLARIKIGCRVTGTLHRKRKSGSSIPRSRRTGIASKRAV